jgi:hypothetical protein
LFSLLAKKAYETKVFMKTSAKTKIFVKNDTGSKKGLERSEFQEEKEV